MGQILHGCATTTAAVRRAIQHSKESLKTLATRQGINPKTVARWRKRLSVNDLPTGPAKPCSSVLTPEEEAVIIAFRQQSLLPLDDCLYALQDSVPHLTRSSLHRCLCRNGISRLPQIQDKKPVRKKFKIWPIGYFHIDIAEVQTAQGRLYMFVAVDRTSKFTFVRLYQKAGKIQAAGFLRELRQMLPYPIHTVLTDNGSQFTSREKDKLAARHIFDRVCDEPKTEHWLTQVNPPWTNGQVERMNRTLREATVRR